MFQFNIKHDRRVKWWLLIISVLTLVVLISAALRENFFSEWRTIRSEYAKILREKAVDERGKTIADQFEISINQNVLPDLEIIDRCITCHPGLDDPRMENEKLPFQTHPGNLLKNHPPDEFGCTICHRGQGRALSFNDAKGIDSYWDYPLLPQEYMQAECGRCHTHMHHTPSAMIKEGNILFNNLGCVECHQIEEGIDNGKHNLSSTGLQLTNRKWWVGHQNYGYDPVSNRKAFVDLTGNEKELLQNFLLSKHGATTLALGQWLYTWYGCGGCHKIQGAGGGLGPDLSNEGQKIKREFSFTHVEGDKSVPNWLYEHFLDPAKVVPDSLMPNNEMTPEEARALTTYVLSLRLDPNLPQAYIPSEARGGRLYTSKGADLYTKYCSACHGRDGEGNVYATFDKGVPAIFNPDFLRIAPSPFIREIVKLGIPDRNMPNWEDGLKVSSLEAVLSYIEEQRPQPQPFNLISEIPSNSEHGEKVFQLNCAICHGNSGEGGIGPKINSSVFLQIADNEFLYSSIVSGRPYTSMPSWADLPQEDLAGLLALFDKWRNENRAEKTVVPEEILPGNPQEGRNVYSAHCARCHGQKGEGGFAAALHNPVLLDSASPEYLAASLNRCREWAKESPIQKERPSGPPSLKQTDLSNVIAYIRTWRKAPIPVKPPLYRPLLDGDAVKGEILFNESCAACHGDKGNNGLATDIGHPKFLNMVSDGYLFSGTVIGRKDTVMDAFGLNKTLSAKEIADIVTYLRSLQKKDNVKSKD